MNRRIFQWQSLQTRITLVTLAVFLIGIWALTLYTSETLREDMQRLLGEQQFSTVSLLAAQVNQDLDERTRGLESVAARVTPTLLGNPGALQTLLEELPVLQRMFNFGCFATRLDGKVIADAPISSGRIGLDFAERDYMVALLKQGGPVIGRPARGPAGSPVFIMAVPIRDATGNMIGILAGATDLGKPSFLDKIINNRYGRTGGYILAAPQQRLTITATDRSRMMQPLPAPGTSPAIDRFVQGYEGTLVYVNQLGVEVLVSARNIPASDWKMVVNLPTAEAFAPIRAMQRNMLTAAIFLSLLAGALKWWILRRQLAPLLATVDTLTALSDKDASPQPLPVTSHDEIGQLIGAFNRLLEGMRRHDDALRESEHHYRTLADSGSALIWTSGLDKRCNYFNQPWLQFTGRPLEQELGNGWTEGVHPDDVDRCLQTYATAFDQRKPFSMDYRLRHANGSYRWISDDGNPRYDSQGQFLGYIGFCTDITERKQVEAELSAHANQLQWLSRRVLEAQETERRRVAIELHDELGQALTAIKINLQARVRLNGQTPAELNTQNIDIIEEALQQVRRLALALRPSMLDDLGLAPALRWLATQTEARGDLVVQVRAADLQSRFAPEIETACFRIVQEALTNIVRHAQAQLVEIDLSRDDDTLELFVQDDGCGFDPAAMRERALAGGSMGVLGMQERAALIGAQLDIQSAPGQGCRVRVCCPLRLNGEAV